jgi:hypothetical protein
MTRLKTEFVKRLAAANPFTKLGLLKGSDWQKALDQSLYRWDDGLMRTGRPETIEEASAYEEG